MKSTLILFFIFSFMVSACKKAQDISPPSQNTDYRSSIIGKYIGIRHSYTTYGPPPSFDTTYTDSVTVAALGSDSINYGGTIIKLNNNTLTGNYHIHDGEDFYVRFVTDSTFSHLIGGGLGQGYEIDFAGKKIQ